jgi:hypothetical protein
MSDYVSMSFRYELILFHRHIFNYTPATDAYEDDWGQLTTAEFEILDDEVEEEEEKEEGEFYYICAYVYVSVSGV